MRTSINITYSILISININIKIEQAIIPTTITCTVLLESPFTTWIMGKVDIFIFNFVEIKAYGCVLVTKKDMLHTSVLFTGTTKLLY